MSSRLSRALRELAAALEEDESDRWEVLSEVGGSSSSVAAGSNKPPDREKPSSGPSGLVPEVGKSKVDRAFSGAKVDQKGGAATKASAPQR